eukprot:gene11300-15160_t
MFGKYEWIQLAITGSVAGATTEFIFYSLDSYKIAQQAGQKQIKGVAGLLKGSLTLSILGSGTNYGVFFALYDPLRIYFENHLPDDTTNKPNAVFLASGLSAIPSSLVSIPADVIKKNMVLGESKTVSAAMKLVWRREGLRGFFVGWKANLVEDVPFACIELSVYESLAKLYLNHFSKTHANIRKQNELSSISHADRLSGFESGLVGFATGVITGTLTCPVDCVNTRIKSGELAQYTVTQAHFEIIRKNGMSGLFRGLENFANYTSHWENNVDGVTAVIKIIPATENFPRNILHTNITNCGLSNDGSGNGACYRAEIKTFPNQRHALFPSNELEYWVGFSSRIPSSWRYKKDLNDQRDSSFYIYQLQDGDNLQNAPLVALAPNGDIMTCRICGNYEKSATASICHDYSLGVEIATGFWDDWVIHSKLSNNITAIMAAEIESRVDDDTAESFVKIWKNGKLLLTQYNILNSYNAVKTPYISYGAYQINWWKGEETSYNWLSVDYSAFKLGDQDSNYDEVYTGFIISPIHIKNGTYSQSFGGSTSMSAEKISWITILAFVLFLIFFIIGFVYHKIQEERRKGSKDNVIILAKKLYARKSYFFFSSDAKRKLLEIEQITNPLAEDRKEFKALKTPFANV